jgi:hypothetical protein
VLYFSPKTRCVSFYFERSCPEQRPRAALKPQARAAPLERALGPGPRAPPPTAEVLARRGVAWSPVTSK